MKLDKQLLWAIAMVLLGSGCYSVRMRHANNEGFWAISLRNDAYNANKHLVDGRIKDYNKSNIDVFVDTGKHPRSYEYLAIADLKTLVAKKGQTFVFFWYTDCPTTTYHVMSAARRLREQQKNALLLCVEYDMERMDKNLYWGKYFYPSYVMNRNPYGKHIVTKIIAYIKALDADYYALLKDDVGELAAIEINEHGKITKGYTHEELKERLANKTIESMGAGTY